VLGVIVALGGVLVAYTWSVLNAVFLGQAGALQIASGVLTALLALGLLGWLGGYLGRLASR
jgi:hypothetical protein